MGLLEQRQKTAEAIAKGRFVKHVLSQESKAIDKNVKENMSGFNSSFWSQRNFSVTNNKLTYTTLKQHRFVDMKTRLSTAGLSKKKRHVIHNKPIFGHLNNIIRELNIGFTEAVKSKFIALDKKQV